MKQSIKIYTAQEEYWLVKVLELLEVEYSKKKVEDNISYQLFEYETDLETAQMIQSLMQYNYKKNFK